MKAYINKPSQALSLLSYLQFTIAGSMMAGGIYFVDATFAAKGFYAMAAIMLVSSTAEITKTIRDNEKSSRLHNTLEDARTERLLVEVTDPEAA